jgi:hypothetical protein
MGRSPQSLSSRDEAPHPQDTLAWFARISVDHPYTTSTDLSDASDAARSRYRRMQQLYGMRRVAEERSASHTAVVIQFPKSRTAAARQGERRSRSTRSSARSGDSGSDDGSEPPAADRWRWASPGSWRAFVESVQSRDFEAEIALERWTR